MKGTLHFVTIIFLLFLIQGMMSCAPEVKKREIDLVWPLPPEEPRIKYVDTVRSTAELGKKRGVAEALFGEREVVAFRKPYGVAVDDSGRIYISDPGRVVMMDFVKKEYQLIGADPGTGRLSMPIGIAIAQDGRIFISDTAIDKVFVYDSEGKFITAFGRADEFGNPSGIAIDNTRGLVYVVNSQKHVIDVYSLSDYSKIRTIGRRGGEAGEFNFPSNIAIDKDGKIYVTDSANFRYQVFDSEGNHLRSVGQLGDVWGSFARPKGIAVDSEGHVYVVDTAFQNYQIFNQQGELLLFVGEGGLEPGKFVLPAGMAIDRQDKIYVVDQYPGVVQIFQYLGEQPK